MTVKVPSTNKAAILDKWTDSSSTIVEPATEYIKPATSPSPIKRIKGHPKPKAQGTSSVNNKSNSELSKGTQYSGSTSSASSNAETGKTLDGSKAISPEFGQRYLEKIHSAQALAKNETLGPEVCVRAGLFRHPSDCKITI